MEKEFINYYKLLGLKFNYTLDELNDACNKLEKEIKYYMESHQLSEERIEELKRYHELVKDAYYVLGSSRERDIYDKKYFDRIHPKDGEDIEYSNKSISVPKKNSFLENLKQSYYEVRQEEKDYSFTKRHKIISSSYRRSFKNKANTLPKEFIYHTGKGVAHVFLEAFYQVYRIGSVKKDTFTKYVLRNRRLLAGVAAAGVIFSSGIISNHSNVKTSVRNYLPIVGGDISIEVTTPDKPISEFCIAPRLIEPTVKTANVIMNRDYQIVEGDTFEKLAENANSSVDNILSLNQEEGFYIGSNIVIPYCIKREDLSYYTETLHVDGQKVDEIAKNYHTDIETLKRLNPEAIVTLGNSTVILSNTIFVPKFISKEEYSSLKAHQYSF